MRWLCLLALVSAARVADHQRLEGGDTSHLPNHGICSSMTIMNTPAKLELLRNCTVIDGFLKVVLMEQDSSINNVTLPLLREVSEYVIFYRVVRLRSIGQLFPNLNLIRGQRLFYDYALIVHEMPNLEELSMVNLMTIQRGAVRVSANPMLCYTDSISWELISGQAKGHKILKNGINACPSKNSCRGCEPEFCWSSMTVKNATDGRDVVSRKCQKAPRRDCHPECLGGCKKTKKGPECYSCKNYVNNGICVPKCPPNKVIHPSAMMCIDKEICETVYPQWSAQGWIWNNTCIHKCPKGYRDIKDAMNQTTCEYCGNQCKIMCEAMEVTNLQALQFFKDCNIINGSLSIRINRNYGGAGDIMNELTEAFQDVQMIMGHLTIYRSATITSLNFFKNLSVITGEQLSNNKYAIVVREMEGLVSLWNWTEKANISIWNGTLQFHNNPKLCHKEIEALGRATNVTVGLDDTSSNGYLAHCHFHTIKATHEVLSPNIVTISWDKVVDHNESVGYLIYYIEQLEDKPIGDFGVDTCADRGWRVKYRAELDNMTQINITTMGHTSYAYYVETYNKGSEKKNVDALIGKSAIGYFKTMMDVPRLPVKLEIYNEGRGQLRVVWEDDPAYKGVISHYLIEAEYQPDHFHHLDLRNYCLSPPMRENITYKKWTSFDDATFQDEFLSGNTRKCLCTRDEWDKHIEDSILVDSVKAHKKHEWEMQALCDLGMGEKNNDSRCDDFVIRITPNDELLQEYLNKITNTRLERNIWTMSDIYELGGRTTPRPPIRNITRGDIHYALSVKYYSDKLDYTIYNLSDYSMYYIYISTCSILQECGQYSMIGFRTSENRDLDRVGNVSAHVINTTHVQIEWVEPKPVNGAILYYSLEYTYLNLEGALPKVVCVQRKAHEESGWLHTIVVHPGMYSYRVRAHSLAQDGEYSELQKFNTQTKISVIWGVFVIICALAGFLVLGYAFYRYLTWGWRSSDYSDEIQLVGSEPEMRVLYRPSTEDEDDDRIEYYDDVVARLDRN